MQRLLQEVSTERPGASRFAVADVSGRDRLGAVTPITALVGFSRRFATWVLIDFGSSDVGCQESQQFFGGRRAAILRDLGLASSNRTRLAASLPDRNSPKLRARPAPAATTATPPTYTAHASEAPPAQTAHRPRPHRERMPCIDTARGVAVPLASLSGGEYPAEPVGGDRDARGCFC
jgi:hypothetical protein